MFEFVESQRDPYFPPPRALFAIPDASIAFGRVVVPVPLHNKPKKTDLWGGEYVEHGFIGDAVTLTLADGHTIAAIDHKFTLNNGISVTYGQINCLAGDFYGTAEPISDGIDTQAQSERFIAAYNTLADVSSIQPNEAQRILAVLRTEVDAVNDALHHAEDPSIAYSKLPDVALELQWITQFRPPGFPNYLGLVRINWDQFGSGARVAYNAGHAAALRAAVDGDLEKAYTLNAFADHFLVASFSSGHLRTPRRGLHDTFDLAGDGCAKLMHDEDCAIGLSVTNSSGEPWTCYGGQRALDKEAIENLTRCVAAMQTSADEVYTAYTSKEPPSSNAYKAWAIAPTLESALDSDAQELAPLFRYLPASQDTCIERRKVIQDRRMHAFTMDWWPLSTWTECNADGWWKYPININGPLKIAPSTCLAAMRLKHGGLNVFYQNSLGGVLRSSYSSGLWTSGVDSPSLWAAAPLTPLAAVEWEDGTQIRVYYFGLDNTLQERCYADGSWAQGPLGNMNIRAARETSVSAFRFERDNTTHIRVYFQEEGSNQIKELCYDNGRWGRGAFLPAAVRGTSIAAILCQPDRLDIRVYYQAEDLSIREHVYDLRKGWSPGGFNGGKAPGKTQICALAHSWRGVAVDLYWMDLNSEIIRCNNIDGLWCTSKVVGPLGRGAKFAPLQWEGGKHVRLYYQAPDNSVLEMCKDNDGEWSTGDHRSSAI